MSSGLEFERIAWAHRCSEDRSKCEDPGAHFVGSDAEWHIFTRLCRGEFWEKVWDA